MDEKILIKKDSYLNIHVDSTEGKIIFNITSDPVNKFKAGDIVYEDGRIMIVKEYPNKCYCLVYPKIDEKILFDCAYADYFGLDFDCAGFRYATEEEKNILFESLKKSGKRWNAEKLCVENVSQQKFKVGDKVRIKNGTSCDSFMFCLVRFGEDLNKFNGRTLTVSGYYLDNLVRVEEGDSYFYEEWLELANKSTDWTPAPEDFQDELKAGDCVVAWNEQNDVVISELKNIVKKDSIYLVGNRWYKNAVKWNKAFEQIEKINRGEL